MSWNAQGFYAVAPSWGNIIGDCAVDNVQVFAVIQNFKGGAH